jgi:hypothetical protein
VYISSFENVILMNVQCNSEVCTSILICVSCHLQEFRCVPTKNIALDISVGSVLWCVVVFVMTIQVYILGNGTKKNKVITPGV